MLTSTTISLMVQDMNLKRKKTTEKTKIRKKTISLRKSPKSLKKKAYSATWQSTTLTMTQS